MRLRAGATPDRLNIKEDKMSLPLEGIKVLELGQWVAAPATCTVLAQWGAEAIKVEPVEGDAMRQVKGTGVIEIKDFNFLFELANHNKKSVALNLKDKQGLDIFYKLVMNVDVMVTNFRLDALPKLGLDYATLHKINPRLIYANINGYGQKGPDKFKKGFDYTAFWARSGIMASLGEPDSPLSNERPGYGDYITAMNTVAGIALALLARQRTGLGQEVTASLLASGIWALAEDIQTSITMDCEVPRLSRKKAGNPLFNCYVTRDERWLQLAMLQTDPFWPAFCKAAGRQELENDPRFNSHAARCGHNEELITIIDGIIGSNTLEYWTEQFDSHDLIWGHVQTIREVTQDPQVTANNYFGEVEHPNYGKQKIVTCPIQLSETPSKPLEASPELGQHTEEVLQEIGYSWEDIARFKEKRVIL